MPPSEESRRAFFRGKRGSELLGRFDSARPPLHIAVIMDGNGRWAAKRGLPRIAGHRAGAKAVREAIASCIELGVRYLTIYSFSSENWNRPRDEVAGLMRLFIEVLERELAQLQRMHVRVRLIGREDGVPSATIAAFRDAERATADNDVLTLLVALNYGGRTELIDAARSVAADVEAGKMAASDIDEEAVSKRLYTSDIPDPDLVVRTSGEMRVSNFLLWQIAYAEFWVTSVLWPDFGRNDLLKAVVDFQGRERRYGGSR